MTTLTDSFVDVPGGYLHYQQQGRGPDVVLVNAAGIDLRMWDTTVAWLAGIARVTTWDCRDTGLSSPSSEPYSEVDDIAAVLDAAGAARATLVGVSNGGRQALAFAHRYPDRVAKVCVVGGSFGEFPEPTAQESAARQAMRAHFADWDRQLRDHGPYAAAARDLDGWAPALSPSDRRRMIGWQVASDRMMHLDEYLGVELEPPIKTRFAEITVPIAVIVGGRDFEGTRLWARRIVEQAARASLLVVPEADHFPMLSAPQRFEQFLRDEITDG
jgi:pimeloyl-ACP methyl ester carboxylesterase